MARTPAATLTNVEAKLLEILWQRRAATVAEVHESLPEPRPAYNSVRTMLNVLEKKGYVRRQDDGRAHVYVAVLERESARRSAVTDIVTRFFGGSPESLVATLLESEQLSGAELERIRELLDETAAAS
jgi:predicted transcriptional regulator